MLIILNRIKIFFELVKFEHTIFALPFAYLGAVLAEMKVPDFYYLVWITLAMVGARTSCMALNRLIDRKIDADNPRTQDRALPKGLIKPIHVKILVGISLLLLFFSAYKLNPLCLVLSPVAVLMLVGYSYLKRVTYGCHLVLGAILGCAPVGGWIAINPRICFVPIILGISVLFWASGFDIIYGTLDIEFDKRTNIHSIPARFGLKKALFISRLMHILTIVGLGYTGLLINLGMYYWIGFGLTILLLIYEHSIISPNNLSRVNQAFFTINGTISIVLFFATLIDICR